MLVGERSCLFGSGVTTATVLAWRHGRPSSVCKRSPAAISTSKVNKNNRTSFVGKARKRFLKIGSYFLKTETICISYIF